MKIGTTASPWRYDAAAGHALQSTTLRQPAMLHYAGWAAVFPIWWGPAYPSIAAVSINSRLDVMDQNQTSSAASRTTSASLRQLVEQGLGLLQIRRVETFCEPSIDRRDDIARLFPSPAVGPMSSKAHGSAQFR